MIGRCESCDAARATVLVEVPCERERTGKAAFVWQPHCAPCAERIHATEGWAVRK